MPGRGEEKHFKTAKYNTGTVYPSLHPMRGGGMSEFHPTPTPTWISAGANGVRSRPLSRKLGISMASRLYPWSTFAWISEFSVQIQEVWTSSSLMSRQASEVNLMLVLLVHSFTFSMSFYSQVSVPRSEVLVDRNSWYVSFWGRGGGILIQISQIGGHFIQYHTPLVLFSFKGIWGL